MSSDPTSRKLIAIARGDSFLAGLRSDGTVLLVGKFICSDEFDADRWSKKTHVDKWSNITHIDAGRNLVVGLKSDGTVLYDGDGGWSLPREIEQWTDIVSISACCQNVIGLKSDGRVVCTTYNRNLFVRDWNDIVSVFGGSDCAFGLRSDGTVVATGKNQSRRLSVERWRNIIAVASGSSYTAGLKSDGTVVIAGDLDKPARSEVENWKGIKSISISKTGYTLYGIKNDGTVVLSPVAYISRTNYIRRATDNWRDIVEVRDDLYFTIGLTSAGSIVYTDHDVDSDTEYPAFFTHKTLDNFG